MPARGDPLAERHPSVERKGRLAGGSWDGQTKGPPCGRPKGWSNERAALRAALGITQCDRGSSYFAGAAGAGVAGADAGAGVAAEAKPVNILKIGSKLAELLIQASRGLYQFSSVIEVIGL